MKKSRSKNPIWLVCFSSIVLVSIYWGLIATDRYVSESNVVLESPQIGPTTISFSSLLTGNGSSGADMLLFRDHLLSVDMLKKVDEELHFRGHYSNQDIDFFSRLLDPHTSVEELHEYYLKRIHVELDEYAQILRIEVQAFTPEMAYRLTQLLLQEGERHMNAMGQRLAEEQVRFLETQVDQLGQRFNATRLALLDYQNVNGLVSPTGTVESLNAVVANLEAELTSLKAKRSVLITYQSPTSPEMIRIDAQIRATDEQIIQERARMAQSSGGALNTVSSEYQTLELKVKFAQESYSGALAALENTRIEAARKLKQVSVLQSPTLPEYAVQPERLYNATVYAIITLFLTLIVQMMMLIIKDHRD